jgi:hypothetical protein
MMRPQVLDDNAEVLLSTGLDNEIRCANAQNCSPALVLMNRARP